MKMMFGRVIRSLIGWGLTMAGTGSASAHPTPDLIHPFLHSAPPWSLFLPCAGTVRGYKTEIGILSWCLHSLQYFSSFWTRVLSDLCAFLKHSGFICDMQWWRITYDAVSDLMHNWVPQRPDFKSALRVVKMLLNTQCYQYLWLSMWFHAKKSKETLKNQNWGV